MVSATTETARGYVVSLSDITFDTGKATLKTDAKYSLAKLAGILTLLQEMTLSVEGHTDSTGSAETNQKLSAARANSVMTFLKEMGVAETRMTAKGFGPDQPVAPNDTAEGRARNRRVEIILPKTQ
jgi:outer membrane protein OmpA-like peptidoglycan-associated protein